MYDMYACIHVYYMYMCVYAISIASYPAPQCPPGMVSQQCGTLCPQTCRNIDQGLCNSGCAEGCFCPDGEVLVNGVCKHVLACPGIGSNNKTHNIATNK